MNPGESYDPLLMSLVNSTSIGVDEEKTNMFYVIKKLSLETIETCIVYVCLSEGEWARRHMEVPLNWVW